MARLDGSPPTNTRRQFLSNADHQQSTTQHPPQCYKTAATEPCASPNVRSVTDSRRREQNGTANTGRRTTGDIVSMTCVRGSSGPGYRTGTACARLSRHDSDHSALRWLCNARGSEDGTAETGSTRQLRSLGHDGPESDTSGGEGGKPAWGAVGRVVGGTVGDRLAGFLVGLVMVSLDDRMGRFLNLHFFFMATQSGC